MQKIRTRKKQNLVKLALLSVGVSSFHSDQFLRRRVPHKNQQLVARTASTPTEEDAHAEEFIKFQSNFPGAEAALVGYPESGPESWSELAARQRVAFDKAAEFFASDSAIPTEVVPRLELIASTAVSSVGGVVTRLLDVGTGTGALLPFFVDQGVRSEALVGIDVSPKMLAHARERFPMSRFIEADFLADHWFDELGSISSRKTQQSDEGLFPNNFSGTPRFDLVVINACFANISPDPRSVLRRAAELCRSKPNAPTTTGTFACVAEASGGCVVVSHPLGSAFVQELSEASPGLVGPKGLPSRLLLEDLIRTLPLSLETFIDESSTGDEFSAEEELGSVGAGAELRVKDEKRRGLYLAVLRCM